MKISNSSLEYRFWQNAVHEKDWKTALDFLIASLRDELIFDNLAIYLEKDGERSEIAYARAVGREKKAEADANWGEGIADQVIAKEEIILKSPREKKNNGDRIANAYLIGYL